MGHLRRPKKVHAAIALAVTVAGAALLWHRFSGRWSWQPWLIAWLAAVNPVAFIYHGFDKWRAGRGGGRVPEAVLHGLAVVGGSLGAYAGMHAFRHKTVKGWFRFTFWAIVILQAAGGAWLLRDLWLP